MRNNKKQSAVKWLEEKWNSYDLSVGKSGFRLFLKQAKEMEKQQIINAYNISGMRSVLYDEQQGDGEDYYNYFINDISE
jgi:hypothetical protein